LAFSLAMIIVGTQNESTCQNEAAQYLTATGSFYLVAGFVYCMSTYLWSEGLVRFFDFVIACIWIVILLWGSITVFSAYPDWNDQDPEHENYCPTEAYLFAFCWLIITWCTIPLACICWGCCTAIVAFSEDILCDLHAVQ